MAEISTGKVLLLGDINIDTFWPVEEFPVPGRDGLVDKVAFEIGGAVVNTAVLLDRLGVQTRLLGCVGEDLWAENILAGLRKTGIDTGSIQKYSNSITGINFTIVTPDGERTMFTHRGANIQLAPENLKEEDFRSASLLHISGYALLETPQRDAVWRAVELAKALGVPISLDSGLEPVMKNPDDFRRLFRELTICISGPEEIRFLYGADSPETAAESLVQAGIQLAAIKLGMNGSVSAKEGEKLFIPCFQVKTVDSTGAGDSFSAGFLYGWLNDLSLAATGTLASALGAIATTVFGAGLAQPQRQDIIHFLQAHLPESSRLKAGIKELIMHFSKSRGV